MGDQPCGLNPQKCHIWGFRNPLGIYRYSGDFNNYSDISDIFDILSKINKKHVSKLNESFPVRF